MFVPLLTLILSINLLARVERCHKQRLAGSGCGTTELRQMGCRERGQREQLDTSGQQSVQVSAHYLYHR